MGHGSALLISFLLAVFICAYVVEGADSCNFNASLSCFGGRSDSVSIDRLFIFLRKEDLNIACSNFTHLKNCVKSKTKDCDKDENNRVKKIWMKTEDSINHVCEKHFQAFVAQKDCLSQQSLSSAAHDCENHHTTHRRYARHTCSEYQEEVKCINKAITNHCGTGGKNIMDRLVRNILSLSDIDHDCEQSSSGRSTEDSIVLSFIMCTASLVLALVLN